MDTTEYLLCSLLLASLGLAVMFQARNKKKLKRLCWQRPWLRRRDTPSQQTMLHLHRELIMDGDEAEFKSTLRMNSDVYAMLLAMIRPGISKSNTNFHRPVSTETRLAITMRYLSLGEGFCSLSQQFRVGLSTTRLIVRETCRAIIRFMQDRFLKTPRTKQEWIRISQEFHSKWNFPHCTGGLDGKHVRILAPKNSGTYFYNYKNFFSIVLFGIVNASYEFIYVSVGAEGKASDGGIWAKCSFKEHMDDPNNPLNYPSPSHIPGIAEEIPYFMVGDDAFKLGPNLLKPYAGAGLTRKQIIFNYRLSRARRVVENVFGILASRFKIYQRTIEVCPDFVEELVLSTCILHNFLRQQASTDYLSSVAVDQDVDGNIIPGDWRNDVQLTNMAKDTQKNPSKYGKILRNTLADYFISAEGEVPWQHNIAGL